MKIFFILCLYKTSTCSYIHTLTMESLRCKPPQSVSLTSQSLVLHCHYKWKRVLIFCCRGRSFKTLYTNLVRQTHTTRKGLVACYMFLKHKKLRPNQIAHNRTLFYTPINFATSHLKSGTESSDR